jgi:hypothetical protein
MPAPRSIAIKVCATSTQTPRLTQNNFESGGLFLFILFGGGFVFRCSFAMRGGGVLAGIFCVIVSVLSISI